MRKGIASTTPVDPVDRFAHWVICWGAVLMLLGVWGFGWAATAIAVGALCVVLGAALDVECQIRGMVERRIESENVIIENPLGAHNDWSENVVVESAGSTQSDWAAHKLAEIRARSARDARVPFEDCAKASWYAFSEGMIMSDPCVSNAQIKRAWPNSVASKRCNALQPGKIIRKAAAQGGEGVSNE